MRYELIKEAVSRTDKIVEVEKFNPYHGADGRFSSSSGYASFTIRTKDPKKQHMADMAIAREKERAGAAFSNPTNDPETIAGVKRGAPMSHEQADEGRANPGYFRESEAEEKALAADRKYIEAVKRGASPEEIEQIRAENDKVHQEYADAVRASYGYRNNCQTCVVAYEARRRGYDVEAMPRDRTNQPQTRLMRDATLAWKDPATGAIKPQLNNDPYAVRTSKQATRWLDENMEEGGRYTFSHGWKGTNGSNGHIIIATKESGSIKLFDPQDGKNYTGDGVTEYMSRVRSTFNNGIRLTGRLGLIRVDNAQFDEGMANSILRGAGQ